MLDSLVEGVALVVLQTAYSNLGDQLGLQIARKAGQLLLGCLGRCLCLARRSHLLAQSIRVPAAHACDVPDQLFPGVDVVLGSDGNLFHDR